MKTAEERVEPRLRAALVPLGSLDVLRGVEEARACLAASVSLGDGRATHLLVLADALPPAFAGSAARIDGARLFFGTDRAAFAEGAEEPPAPEPGWLTFRLRGLAPCLRLRAESLRPLEDSIDAEWDPLPAPARPLAPVPFELRLRPSGDARPATGLLLCGDERRGLEEILSAWPESRFEGARFAAGPREAFLCARDPGPLEGLPGAAFHAVDLGVGRALYLPAGRDLELAFAPAILPGLLGDEGEAFFWLDSGIVAIPGGRLHPLTRREWRSRGGSP